MGEGCPIFNCYCSLMILFDKIGPFWCPGMEGWLAQMRELQIFVDLCEKDLTESCVMRQQEAGLVC